MTHPCFRHTSSNLPDVYSFSGVDTVLVAPEYR